MKVQELIWDDRRALAEWKASRDLCTGSKPDSAIGASALASCKSQGLRRRSGKKSHLIRSSGDQKASRVTMGGKKIRGKKYGGSIPDYGSGSKSSSKKRKS